MDWWIGGSTLYHLTIPLIQKSNSPFFSNQNILAVVIKTDFFEEVYSPATQTGFLKSRSLSFEIIKPFSTGTVTLTPSLVT